MSQKQTASARGELPRRPITPIVVPAVVLVCILALLSWSAWPVLRPSRAIDVTQALIVPSSQSEPESAREPGNISQQNGTRTVQAAGWLEAEPYIVVASALADGIVQEVLFLEGDYVEQNQPLARLIDDNARLSLARADAAFGMARAGVDLAKARLQAAQRNWEAPYELERAVARSQARLEELRAELAQLPSLVQAERALLVKAEEEHKRIEMAYRSSSVSEIEFISAREQVNIQTARLSAVEAREAILNASVNQATADVVAAQRAIELRIDDQERLHAAQSRLQLSEAELALRAAARDEAQLELDRMTIRSPITGYIQRRNKVPGDKVMRAMDEAHSAHIAYVYDPGKLQVRVDVPLADAAQVYVGQQCEVVVEVLSDRTFRGEVILVLHEADLQKNTLQVKVRVLDPDPILRPEMLTRVKFIARSGITQTHGAVKKSSVGAVRVPAQVIDHTEDGARVWVVSDRANGRGVLRPVPVTIMNADTEWVTVCADLNPGAILASDPRACVTGERVLIASAKGGTP